MQSSEAFERLNMRVYYWDKTVGTGINYASLLQNHKPTKIRVSRSERRKMRNN